MKNNTDVSIAITNLGKYNEGYLTYKWLNLPLLDGELEEALEEIGINSEYEEYFISDYDSNIDIRIGEYTNIKKLSDNIEEIANSQEPVNVINAIASQVSTIEELIIILNHGDYSIIEATNNSDIGYAIFDMLGVDVDPYISNYIDYSAIGRDSAYTLCDGDIAIELY